MNIPFIKLLDIKEKYYFYDVNKNKIVKITRDSYETLKKIVDSPQKENTSLNQECLEYYNHGFLQNNKISRIQNIDFQEIIKSINSNLQSLLLQLTRDCNMRCKYCFYSGKYANIRKHENVYMDTETCRKAIDFFLERAFNSKTVNIGFYGGEPLLNFKVLKDSVKYIKEKYPFLKVKYSITTNGILLIPEIADFLIENDFSITLSIDGPKKIHDSNRILINGEGSYDIVIDNIRHIYENNLYYFKKNIRYNAVVTKNHNTVQDFFRNDDMFKLMSGKLSSINNYHSNTVSENHDNKDNSKSNKLQNRIRSYVNYLKGEENENNFRLKHIIESLNTEFKDPLVNAIAAGICIPGISRLFVTVHGDFYMCEKLDDNSDYLKIGNLSDGWNEENIYKLSNISNTSSEFGCKNCWAIRLCNMCAAKICAIPPHKLNEKCEETRRNLEMDLRDICILYDIKGDIQ